MTGKLSFEPSMSARVPQSNSGRVRHRDKVLFPPDLLLCVFLDITTNGRHVSVWKRTGEIGNSDLSVIERRGGLISEQSGREVWERLHPPPQGLVQKRLDERLCSVSWSGNEESVAKEERGPVSEQSGIEVRERLCPPRRGLVQKGPDERLCSVSGSGFEEAVAKEV